MADTEGENTVNLSTKLGTLSLGGKNALDIALLITMLALAGLTVYEHIQRSMEHDTITCEIKLNLFMQAQDLAKPIEWRKMPVDLFNCIPKFLYDRDQGAR